VNTVPQFITWLLKEAELPIRRAAWHRNQPEETGIQQVDSSQPQLRISETAFLCASSYNVSEKAGSVSVTVQRSGNLNQYAIVLCRTEQGTASSSSRVSSQPGQQDYVEYAGQVQFDEREDTKSCTIVINDDDVFENVESFTVELSMPAYALLGEFTQAKVIINDTEDEPTLEFDKKTYRVNESAGFLFAPIERKGDSSSIVSAICYTVPKSERTYQILN